MLAHTRLWSFLPPILLATLIGTVATAVDRLASPPGGLQLARPASNYGSSAIRIEAPTYPRESVDSDDLRIRIPRPAHRIVSQSRTTDEYLYSIAPPQTIMAVSASAYQQSSSNVYSYVTTYHPQIASDPERVVRLDPDLIFVSSTARADFTSLVRNTGVPTYRMFTMFTNLDQVAESIRAVGYLTGADESARNEEARFRSGIAAALAIRTSGPNRPRILGLGGLACYGRDTLFNDIVEKLGGINVGAEGGVKGYENVGSEIILRWDPEWIVTAADPGKAEQARARLLADPAIALTQAARQGHILVFDNRMLFSLSPFTLSLVNAMAEQLYGKPQGHAGNL
jgi:iron complex transport system substrate-binding protein